MRIRQSAWPESQNQTWSRKCLSWILPEGCSPGSSQRRHVPTSARFSFSVTKRTDQRQLGEKGVCFLFHFRITIHHWEEPGKEFPARSWRQAAFSVMKELNHSGESPAEPWRLTHWLGLSFFYTAQYPLLEDWILLHKLTISIIPHMRS